MEEFNFYFCAKSVCVCERNKESQRRGTNCVMEALTKFNNLSSCTEYSNKKLAELVIDLPYVVQIIRPVQTRFGRKIVVDINIEDEVTSVFLPAVFSKLSTSEIDELNSMGGTLMLVYLGLKNRSHQVILKQYSMAN